MVADDAAKYPRKSREIRKSLNTPIREFPIFSHEKMRGREHCWRTDEQLPQMNMSDLGLKRETAMKPPMRGMEGQK